MTELVFEISGEDEPGHLRRVIKANRFLQGLREKVATLEYYEEMIDFLLGFVKEPGDRDEAREALLDASRKQYQELLNAVVTGKANPTSPNPKETN
jgi:hypothetical protein